METNEGSGVGGDEAMELDVQGDDSGKKKRKECQICFDTASGCHFGVVACEGCKGFFRRNIQKNAKFVCFYDNKCDVFGIKKRKSCQKCRMEACLKQGMNAAMIKKNNIRKPGERRKQQDKGNKPQLALMGNLGKIDKTAGFKNSMRHSITSLTTQSSSRAQSSGTTMTTTQEDSGFVTLKNDDNQSSLVSHGSTNVSTCSRQSVLRHSEAGTGRIYVIDSVTKERTLDVQSMVYTRPRRHGGGGAYEGNSMSLSSHMPPSRVRSMPGGVGHGQYSRTSGVLREPSSCSDTLTRDIFANIEETLGKVSELCKTCYQYNTLIGDDATKLFDAAKFELVFVYIYFEDRTRVSELGTKSSPMMRGLIENLEKCEITTWGHVKSIIMMSLLAHDRMGSAFYQNLDQIKQLRKATQDELTRTMSESAANGLQRYVNVMLLLPVLREMNEYWCSCPVDANGCPILVDRSRVRFG